jgi:SAM-dependent methyltransferase
MRDVPFFGELYRRTTTPMLSGDVTRAEASFIARALGLGGGSRALDLGCGEGRHLGELAPLGARLIGVDSDPGSLEVARAHAAVCAGDLLALPLRTASFDAAWCWYSTLFVFDEADNRRSLCEAARVLRPGARFAFQTVNPARLAQEPEASFERVLPGGALVRERSRFDAARGVDEGTRTLELPGREVQQARWRLRYYHLEELEPMFRAAGLRIVSVFGSVQGEPFSAGSLDLIALSCRE